MDHGCDKLLFLFGTWYYVWQIGFATVRRGQAVNGESEIHMGVIRLALGIVLKVLPLPQILSLADDARAVAVSSTTHLPL